MNHRFLFTCVAFMAASVSVSAQSLSADVLQQLQQSYKAEGADKAIRNAIANNDLKALAVNLDNQKAMDTHFTYQVTTKGISNQKSSGRCWLFTGLNVMRAKAIARYDLPAFEFSQNYSFFFDQLEKANLFLQAILDTAQKPLDDKKVDWLLHNVLSDGGTFCGVSDVVLKYGLVPKDVMLETHSSENTKQMASLIILKLKEDALKLREMVAAGKKVAALQAEKVEMLKVVYRILALNLGVPPTEFDFVRKNAKGEVVETEHHTPQSFLEKYGDKDLLQHYVMLMNDPTRPYYKTYEIDLDRHTYDGQNWVYLNLPTEDIKQMAIESLNDNTAMYFSCDVGKELDSKRGLLDLKNYDYASLLGTSFGMDKKQRIATFASGSSHAMMLAAVDLKDGKPVKWMVENSWGATYGHNGYLIMTDEWFDEYMFRLVVEDKYVPAKIKDLFKKKPTLLPAWDPMFAPEE